jgi:hypothetical protein
VDPHSSRGYPSTLKKNQISIIFNRSSCKKIFKFNYKTNKSIKILLWIMWHL